MCITYILFYDFIVVAKNREKRSKGEKIWTNRPELFVVCFLLLRHLSGISTSVSFRVYRLDTLKERRCTIIRHKNYDKILCPSIINITKIIVWWNRHDLNVQPRTPKVRRLPLTYYSIYLWFLFYVENHKNNKNVFCK